MATKYSAYSNIANATTKYFFEVDGYTVGWYVADDLTTITKDGSDLVSQWNDKLGSGHNLTAAGVARPTWTPTGILFNGIANVMKTATFAWNQPEMIYMVYDDISGINGKCQIDGFDGTHRGLVWRNDATENGKHILYAGTLVSSGVAILLGWRILRVLFNGANSFLKIGTTSSGAKNAGAQNMAGLTLGANITPGGFSNIRVAELICRNVVEGGTDETTIYNYLKTKYGL